MSGTHRADRASGTSTSSTYTHEMNARLLEATGRSFDDWFDTLDDAGAHTWPDWRIKRYLGGQRKNDEWWATAVTQEYKRARTYTPTCNMCSIRVTKTIPASLEESWAFIDDPDERRAWLDIELDEHSRTGNTILRANLADNSQVTISLRQPTNPARKGTLVTIRHSHLADTVSLDETKAFWRSCLKELEAITQ